MYGKPGCEMAEWSTEQVNDLPDSSFGWIEPGGSKDESGKTAPRSLRHLPFKDKDGKVDAAHARNALARLDQVKGMPSETRDKLRTSLQNALEKANGEMGETYRFTAPVELAEGQKTSTVELLRTGIVRDRGLRITEGMLDSYIKNFNEGAYGQKIRVTVGHKRDNGGDDPAAGWVEKLDKRKNEDGSFSLMGEIAWTELGEENVSKKLFLYVSSEIASAAKHADTGKPVSHVFLGAALTNTPAIKRQQPIQLTEEDEARFTQKFTMLKKLIESLNARKSLTAEDIKLCQDLLAETTDTAELEELKPRVAELAEKLKKQLELAEGDDEEEEDEDEEEKKKEAAAAAKKGGKKTEMTEDAKKVQALTEQLDDMKKKLEHKELSEVVANEMLLSEEKGVSVGFNDEAAADVTAFMETLTEEQRETFKGLVAKVRNVDFTVRGAAGEKTKLATGSVDEKIAALAEKFMADDPKLDVVAAQKKAAAQLAVKFA